MIEEFVLTLLLDILSLSRSTYYYQVKRLSQADKDRDLKEAIQEYTRNIRGDRVTGEFILN
ncbi:hypothetical protein HMPREF1557_00992 [Streptococcus sobrinus W1703]|uniref:Uncharacterized protein n=1 Tax=Streptococcus sobrinus W1703 TaxID=1227275 RepID=U2J9F5_9STRE|nr:hypothetical protein HMPREF1557_00992 [Streptococcus sobrinus W1703]